VSEPARRIRRTPDGDFELALSSEERAVLHSLPEQLREILSSDDPVLGRLFPPAYPDDADLQAEYAGLVGDDLRDQRLDAALVMEQTIDAERLSEEQIQAWLGALNDLRLILGTRLGAADDDLPEIEEDDPMAPSYALYFYLGWLEEQVVEALST
jgi:hypothetical protein